jgi:uncharacterized damage-inducible protein DinB
MDRTLKLVLSTFQPRRGQAWHGGPTPVGAVRGVSARLARWRPAPGRHSIWELTLHNAYWNHAIRRRLLGAAIPRFPRSPANWPAVPATADEGAWKRDRELLDDEHQLLAETIADFPAELLGRSAGGGKRWTWGDLVIGIAMHDAYHTGQIQMLKRIGKRR